MALDVWCSHMVLSERKSSTWRLVRLVGEGTWADGVGPSAAAAPGAPSSLKSSEKESVHRDPPAHLGQTGRRLLARTPSSSTLAPGAHAG